MGKIKVFLRKFGIEEEQVKRSYICRVQNGDLRATPCICIQAQIVRICAMLGKLFHLGVSQSPHL